MPMTTSADLLTNQIAPHNIEAERAVLGCVLLEHGEAWSRIATRLEADDFYLERHRRLWSVFRGLVADELAIDLVTTLDRLRIQADALDVAPAGWLAELVDEATTLTSLPSYAALGLRDSARRLMIQQASHALQQAYDPEADPVETATRASIALGQLASRAQDRKST